MAAPTTEEAPGTSPRAAQAIFSGPKRIDGRKAVYLTYDDGPAGGDTRHLVQALLAKGIRATFFVVGQNAASTSGQRTLRYLARSGMSIGMHSWSHPSMRGWSTSAVLKDFRRTSAVIRKATGSSPTCFRPPYGSYGRGVLSAAGERHVKVVMWDIDPTDWRNPGARVVANRVLANLHPGAIVVMHDGAGHGKQAAAAVARIVDGARRRGYVFGTLCPPARR